MKNRLFLYLSTLLLAGCGKAKVEGDWILNAMFYQGKEIYPESYSSKMIMNPVPFANKENLTFQAHDKTGIFPGIQSPDIRIKWQTKGDSIYIAADSLFLEETILKPIKYLQTDAVLNQDAVKQQWYEHQKDSILANIGFRDYAMTLDVYTGRYKMEKYADRMILVSNTTILELVNKERAYDAAINKVFPKR
jgi:hypothetical protein